MKHKSWSINNAIALLLILSLFWLSACISTLTVRKVGKNNRDTVTGIRYSLPKPFLLVTPSETGDGTFTVEVVYFPDINQTYAIEGQTILGKHKLNVKIKEGLLEKITWSQDDTAVAAEAIRVGGELKKAALEQKKADEDEAKAELKAAQDISNALKKEVSEKQLALDLAKLELSSLEASLPRTPNKELREALRLARLAVKKAEIQLTKKEEELNVAQEISDLLSTHNATRNENDEKTVYGPMLYEIKDTINWDGSKGRIQLVPVKWETLTDGQTPNETKKPFQEKFRTALIIQEPPVNEEDPPALTFNGTEIFWETNGKIIINRTFNKDIGEVDWEKPELEYPDGNRKSIDKTHFVGSIGRNIKATFKGLKEGAYTIILYVEALNAKPADSDKLISIDFLVKSPPPNPIPRLTASGVEMVSPDEKTGNYVITRHFIGKIKSLNFEDSSIAMAPYSDFKPLKEFPIAMVLKKGQPLKITIREGMTPGFYKLRVVFNYIVKTRAPTKTGTAIVQFKVSK